MAVEVENWEERESLTHIQAVIHVEKASQKRIVVGAGGSRIKAVGEAARADLEELLGKKVYLELFVRIEGRWTESPKSLRRFGYLGGSDAKGRAS